jgi:hypothetical protein
MPCQIWRTVKVRQDLRVDTSTSLTSSKTKGLAHRGIDAEVAKFAEANSITISVEENKRLVKLINKRILVFMLVT